MTAQPYVEIPAGDLFAEVRKIAEINDLIRRALAAAVKRGDPGDECET